MELLQLLISGIAQGCVYGLLALGFVLIYKATEQVNFAQGDIMMMGTFFAFAFITGTSKPVSWWSAPIAILAICVGAALVYLLHKRRLPAWRDTAASQPRLQQVTAGGAYWLNLLAIVALYAVAAIFAIRFLSGFGMSWWLALPLAAICGGVLGYTLDAVIVRRIIGQPQFAVVILTLALGFMMRAVAGAIWGADDKGFTTPYSGDVIRFGGGEGTNPVVIGVPSLVIIGGTAVMIIGLYLFFRFTKIGVAMQAASQNQLAAYYMGIPVKYVFSMIWAISAAVATVAGILLVPKLEVFSPEVGLLSITAFAAAVVGGFGSLPGAILGGLIIGIAEALSTRYLPDILIDIVGLDGSFANKIPQVIAYIIMLAVLIIRPQGLFAQIQRKKV